MNRQAKKHGVCDLEYAVRLKELGVKQESLWWWNDWRPSGSVILTGKYAFSKGNDEYIEYSSAFTVAELLEGIPSSKIIEYAFKFYHEEEGVDVDLLDLIDALKDVNEVAKMVIYLKEKGLV